jgi:hypothetical protein
LATPAKPKAAPIGWRRAAEEESVVARPHRRAIRRCAGRRPSFRRRDARRPRGTRRGQRLLTRRVPDRGQPSSPGGVSHREVTQPLSGRNGQATRLHRNPRRPSARSSLAARCRYPLVGRGLALSSERETSRRAAVR